jgi:hypothetical protein
MTDWYHSLIMGLLVSRVFSEIEKEVRSMSSKQRSEPLTNRELAAKQMAHCEDLWSVSFSDPPGRQA